MKRYHFDTVVFDLDGVITKTAVIHAKAWKETFDEYMKIREKRDGEPFREFTHENDYLPYVDGKPRYDGVKSFLESRGINIPYGDPKDSSDKETICGVGNKKNDMFRKVLDEQGAEVYTTTVDFIRSLKDAGMRVGVASSSKNCLPILRSAGLEDLFETRVDGVVSADLGLKGKPEGDIFVKATYDLEGVPERAIVVEDATSGVQAGRNGGFGLVLGIARENNEEELLNNGADLVVKDMGAINIDLVEEWFSKKPADLFRHWDTQDNLIEKSLPQIYKNKDIIVNPKFNVNAKGSLLNDKKPVIFLDYDGTLTPIVSRPDLAVISDDMRNTVKKLSEKYTVAIVSGRQREDVENLLGIKGLLFAGSHGFDIMGAGFDMVHPKVKDIVPTVNEIIKVLKKEIGEIEGALVEEKKFSVAVHYRLAADKDLPKIKESVDSIMKNYKGIRLMSGKKVFEILPDIEWNKGKAIRWIMEAMKLSWGSVSAVYIGDDTTDEFAFRAMRTRGTPILVSEKEMESAADFRLKTPEDVKGLFEKLI